MPKVMIVMIVLSQELPFCAFEKRFTPFATLRLFLWGFEKSLSSLNAHFGLSVPPVRFAMDYSK
jgi:hypothetical protein